MKTTLLLVSVFLISATTVFAQTDFMVASNVSRDSVSEKSWPAKKAVKIYPNPSYGKLSVSSVTSTTLHFYIFDLEGTLVYQAVLKNRERKSIGNLKKGTYLYDVFENDLSIEEGKIIIK